MNNVLSVSQTQHEFLQEIHERLVLKQPPISAYYMRSGKGLLKRGLIKLDTVVRDGKQLIVLAITEQGIEYLQQNS